MSYLNTLHPDNDGQISILWLKTGLQNAIMAGKVENLLQILLF
jgi:hypothetical protein